MTEARLQSEWDRTCMIVAKLHNVNCTKKADMIADPSTLNPLRRRAPKPSLPLKEIRRQMTR